VNYVDPTGLWVQVGDTIWEAQRGDTLWGLSEIVYGNGSLWTTFGYQDSHTNLQVGEIIDVTGWGRVGRNMGGYVDLYGGGQLHPIVDQMPTYTYTPPAPAPSKPSPPAANTPTQPTPSNPGNNASSSTSSPGNGGGGNKPSSKPNTGSGGNGKNEIYGPPVPPNLYGPPDSLKQYTFGIKDFDDKYKAVSTLILRLASDIIRAAKSKNVDAQVLAGVIFAENMLNVSFVDKYLEYPVYMGLPNLIDFSLGVAQVRISTAKYLEEKGYMPVIKGKWSFIVYFSANEVRATLLQDDYYCILYAAAYLRLLADLWKDDFSMIEYRPDIWGSLYNLGHGKKPHSNPKPNSFGELVGLYYDHMGDLLYTYNERG